MRAFGVPRLRTMSCARSGRFLLSGTSLLLERINLWVADELAGAGLASGEAFRFMRKALGLKATDLSELVYTTPETISRWETGKLDPIDPNALALLGALVADRIHGRETLRDRLRALRSPRRVENTVVRFDASLLHATA